MERFYNTHLNNNTYFVGMYLDVRSTLSSVDELRIKIMIIIILNILEKNSAVVCIAHNNYYLITPIIILIYTVFTTV